MSRKIRNAVSFGAAIALVAVVVFQVGFVNAGRPQYEVRRATMVGQPSGPPIFVEDPDGSVDLHWDLSYGRMEAFTKANDPDQPQPEPVPGFLSVKVGQPPACVCPNGDRSCLCQNSGNGGNQDLQPKR